jgi:hypothetical protein
MAVWDEIDEPVLRWALQTHANFPPYRWATIP